MTRITRRSSLRSAVNSGKENNGGVMSKSTTKVKKSKARPMPDFSKIHKKWEKKFNSNKEQAKKPLTAVQEFVWSKKGERVKCDEDDAEHRSRAVDVVETTAEQDDDDARASRESFTALALQQQQLAFEPDSNALQSILNETGVSLAMTSTAQPSITQTTARETESMFKVPTLQTRLVSVTPCGKRFSALRESLSHHGGCKTCLTTTTSKFGKPPLSVTHENEVRNAPNTPYSERKAERVLTRSARASRAAAVEATKSPGQFLGVGPQRVPCKSPAMMSRLRSSARSTGKRIISTWRDALRSGSAVADDVTTNKKTQKDKLAMQLHFEDDGDDEAQRACDGGRQPSNAEDDVPLPRLEEVEKELESSSSDSKRLTSLSRPVLGELPAAEVAKRSNPSFRYERAPCAKLKSKSHGAIPKTTMSKSKRVQFESPTRATGGSGAAVTRNMSPSSRYNILRNSPAGSSSTASHNSPKAAKASALRFRHEARYSPMSKKFMMTSAMAGSKRPDAEVFELMCDLDKENATPRQPLLSKAKSEDLLCSKYIEMRHDGRKSSVKLLKENDEEYVILEESFRDMSIEQLDLTLNESQLALQELTDEAANLLQRDTNSCGAGDASINSTTFDDDSSALDIAAQLQLIQQKQQELMRMQTALHKRLAKKQRKKQQKEQQSAASKSSRRPLEKYDQMIKNSEVRASASKQSGGGGLNDAFSVVMHDAATTGVTSSENVVDVSPIDADRHKGAVTSQRHSQQKRPSPVTTPQRSVASSMRHAKRQTVTRGAVRSVVDMSPIMGNDDVDAACTVLADDDVDDAHATTGAAYRTPEKHAAASPTLLYNANKRSPLFPPLESTASDSVCQRHAGGGAHNDDDVMEADVATDTASAASVPSQAAGVSLAAGLLQMAQHLDAVPHRSRHWKKQMLHVDDDVVTSPSAHCSFDAGYQMKQASVRRVESMTSPAERPPPCVTSLSTVSDVSFTMPAYYDGTEHGVAEQLTSAITPIGTPRSASVRRLIGTADVSTTPCNTSPVMCATPQTVIRRQVAASPLGSSSAVFATTNPQRIMSGSAHVIPLQQQCTSPTSRQQVTQAAQPAMSAFTSRILEFEASPSASPSQHDVSLVRRVSAFKSPSTSAASPVSGPTAFRSPVQFTLNRRQSPSIVRPQFVQQQQKPRGAVMLTSRRSPLSPLARRGRMPWLVSETTSATEVRSSTSASRSARITPDQEQKSRPALDQQQKSTPALDELSELSLRTSAKKPSPLKRGGWSVLQTQLLEVNRAKYLDTLQLDSELQAITSSMPTLAELMLHEKRCCDPVASLLHYGDDSHFIPISPEVDDHLSAQRQSGRAAAAKLFNKRPAVTSAPSAFLPLRV